MAAHPADPKVAFASWADGGVYKSTDSGVTWVEACKGITWRDVPEENARPNEYQPECWP